MAQFPALADLAAAPLDAVLHLWSGLGYYARARHLHQAAQILWRDYAGMFPEDLKTLQALPGIGRSTAGAILALACGQRQAILDGNVKRVLCRYHALDGHPDQAAVQRRLWQLAEQHTPARQTAAYTQAMMDLGATVCKRSRPLCQECPLSLRCEAYRRGETAFYPRKRQSKILPQKCTAMLVMENTSGQVLLQQRTGAGVWQNLWGFPECPVDTNYTAWCRDNFDLIVEYVDTWQGRRHTFSHFHLDIVPVHLRLQKGINDSGALEKAVESSILWYDPEDPPQCGLASPVKRLLQEFQKNRRL